METKRKRNQIGDNMVTIKIGDMKNVPWKKTKATLSIMIQSNLCTFIIKDCRLIDGVNGMYVAGPSKQYQNNEGETTYFQFLDLDRDAQHHVIEKAQNSYDSNQADYKMYDAFPRPEITKTKSGVDDSIPF